MNNIKLLIYALLLFTSTLQAQQKYWIYLKDKTASRDEIMEVATSLKTTPIVISNWLNAYSTILEKGEIEKIYVNEKVESIGTVSGFLMKNELEVKPFDLYKTLEQINADTLINLGINGQGVKIGIIDAGFLNADKNKYLKNLIDKGQVKGYKNYIDPELSDPYGGSSTNNDDHGTEVIQYVAGKNNNEHTGLASESLFYLARSDKVETEHHFEEDLWIESLEWMHNQGVRLVNSSLGYSDGFDAPDVNYIPSNVDGKFSAITRAAEIAINEKGMTIVISAGNDGDKDFKVISIPADAKGTIAVGSTGYRYWDKLSYSSIGPEHLDMIKPDFSCHASGGTSFSAPIITGLIACMKQLNPDLTNDEIINLLAKSSHLYPYPNNYLGYGVPDVKKVLTLMSDSDKQVWNLTKIKAKDTLTITLPKSYNIMAFHKKDTYLVLKQEKLRWREDKVFVDKPQGTTFTTVANGYRVWEIEWID